MYYNPNEEKRDEAIIASIPGLSSNGRKNAIPINKLGEGAYNRVYGIGSRYVAKIPKIDWSTNPNGLVEDGDTICYNLQKNEGLPTQGIVKIYTTRKNYVVMERCSDGDLEQLRKRNGSRAAGLLEEGGVLNIMSGLNELHKLGYVHRDIKLANILCTAEGELKISDFGLVSVGSDSSTERVGTEEYFSPEKFMKSSFDDGKADCWAAGCVFYKLLCKKSIKNIIYEACGQKPGGNDFYLVMDKFLYDQEAQSNFRRIMSNDLNNAKVGPLMQMAVRELLNPDRHAARGVGEILEMVEEEGKNEEHRAEYETMQGTERRRKEEEKKRRREETKKRKEEEERKRKEEEERKRKEEEERKRKEEEERKRKEEEERKRKEEEERKRKEEEERKRKEEEEKKIKDEEIKKKNEEEKKIKEGEAKRKKEEEKKIKEGEVKRTGEKERKEGGKKKEEMTKIEFGPFSGASASAVFVEEKKKAKVKKEKAKKGKKKSGVEDVTKIAAVSALGSSCHTVNRNVGINNISFSQNNTSVKTPDKKVQRTPK
ncbi:MAG: protein kinase [Rickettsiales bacterium]|jgi:serine/threonine protein kinase|nr:protein kinase [Rickettsiales bacterium]